MNELASSRSQLGTRLRMCAAAMVAGMAPGSLAAEFPAVVELSDLLAANGGDGSDGFVMHGVAAGDSLGFSVSGAGDVNDDGLFDLIVGARRADPGGRASAGQTYVVFGSDTAFPAQLDLATLNGANGFVVNGIAPGDFSGGWVSRAGDVNHDGVDDVLISAPVASPGGRLFAGQCYVVFGSSAGFSATLELAALDGGNGVAMNGEATEDFLGWGVSGVGDVNADGVDDVLLGAEGATVAGNVSAGKSYVVFGQSTGFSASLELSSLDGVIGFSLTGQATEEYSGTDVAAAGDTNNDGIGDFVIAAPGADPDGRANAGVAYVVFGRSTGFPATVALSSLGGNDGYAIAGVDPGDFLGHVSGAGDLNDDGLDDVFVSAPNADVSGDPDAGESYVVFGRVSAFPPTLELSALDGSDGFAIGGAAENDFSGLDVSLAGDVNGDGIDDLVIGAPVFGANFTENAGELYVVYGTRSVVAPSLDLGTLDATRGFVIRGVEANDSAAKVANLGDFNGDGIDDLIIGAPGINFPPSTGKAYVLFGRSGDEDGDGVSNSQDNCSFAANPDQLDTNADGFGNRCDPDLNGDCVVNAVDLGLFRSVFFCSDSGQECRDADLNGDGVVNPQDLGIFRSLFFERPGPSGSAGPCTL